MLNAKYIVSSSMNTLRIKIECLAWKTGQLIGLVKIFERETN